MTMINRGEGVKRQVPLPTPSTSWTHSSLNTTQRGKKQCVALEAYCMAPRSMPFVHAWRHSRFYGGAWGPLRSMGKTYHQQLWLCLEELSGTISYILGWSLLWRYGKVWEELNNLSKKTFQKQIGEKKKDPPIEVARGWDRGSGYQTPERATPDSVSLGAPQLSQHVYHALSTRAVKLRGTLQLGADSQRFRSQCEDAIFSRFFP